MKTNKMKFVFGSIPEDKQFEPKKSAWTPLVEPHPGWLQFPAVLLGAMVCALLFVGMIAFSSIHLPPQVSYFRHWKVSLVTFLLIIPIHELLHALAHPYFGRSDRTVIGFWPRSLLFFAHYEGKLTRERFVGIMIFPFLTLSIGPILFAIMFDLQWWLLGLLPLINALFSSVDLVGSGMILWQIPYGATVRNKGWRTYWHVSSEERVPSMSEGFLSTTLKIIIIILVIICVSIGTVAYVTMPMIDGYQMAHNDLEMRDHQFKSNIGYLPSGRFFGQKEVKVYQQAPVQYTRTSEKSDVPPDPLNIYHSCWHFGYRRRMNRSGYDVVGFLETPPPPKGNVKDVDLRE